MEIFDVLRIPIHAGSIRVYTQNKKKGKNKVEEFYKDHKMVCIWKRKQ